MFFTYIWTLHINTEGDKPVGKVKNKNKQKQNLHTGKGKKIYSLLSIYRATVLLAPPCLYILFPIQTKNECRVRGPLLKYGPHSTAHFKGFLALSARYGSIPLLAHKSSYIEIKPSTEVQRE